MELSDYIELPPQYVTAVSRTGSSYICNPPVTTTDIDFVVLSPKGMELREYLVGLGWNGNEGYPIEVFSSLKKDNINIIIVEEHKYFHCYKVATELAKRLNLLDKEQRIMLFDHLFEREAKLFEYEVEE